MRLGFTRFIKILFSSFFIQTSWSFFSMQGMGFLFTLVSGAEKNQGAEGGQAAAIRGKKAAKSLKTAKGEKKLCWRFGGLEGYRKSRQDSFR